MEVYSLFPKAIESRLLSESKSGGSWSGLKEGGSIRAYEAEQGSTSIPALLSQLRAGSFVNDLEK